MPLIKSLSSEYRGIKDELKDIAIAYLRSAATRDEQMNWDWCLLCEKLTSKFKADRYSHTDGNNSVV